MIQIDADKWPNRSESVKTEQKVARTSEKELETQGESKRIKRRQTEE